MRSGFKLIEVSLGSGADAGDAHSLGGRQKAGKAAKGWRWQGARAAGTRVPACRGRGARVATRGANQGVSVSKVHATQGHSTARGGIQVPQSSGRNIPRGAAPGRDSTARGRLLIILSEVSRVVKSKGRVGVTAECSCEGSRRRRAGQQAAARRAGWTAAHAAGHQSQLAPSAACAGLPAGSAGRVVAPAGRHCCCCCLSAGSWE